MSKVIVVWAWESHGQQQIHAMVFEDMELAERIGSALAQVQGDQTYSRVRLFRTPDLMELELPGS